MEQKSLISSIGTAIKHYRNLNNISLSALAKEAKVSKSTLFALELGDSNPTISTLEAISRALHTDIETLIKYQKMSGNSALRLIESTSINSDALYQLHLNALEEFSYCNVKSQSVSIDVIYGAVTILESGTTLIQGSKIELQNSFRAIAGVAGVKAIMRIVSLDTPQLLPGDIFLETISKEQYRDLCLNSYASSITRVILLPKTELKEYKKIPPYSNSKS